MTSFTTMSTGGAPGAETGPALRAVGNAHLVSRAELVAQADALETELADLRRARDEEQAENERLGGRLHRLLEVLPAGVVVLDGRGRVSECNAAAQALLGEQLRTGGLWRVIVASAFAPRPDDGPEVSLASGRRVSISTRSLGTEPGQIILLTDVTESRELREALARVQRNSAVGSLAATLAHQVRTPLASALLYASGLRDQRQDEEQRVQGCERIIERLRHMEKLVEDMLQFSRQGSFEMTAVTLGDLLDEIGRGRGAATQGFHCDVSGALRELPLAANLRGLASAIDNLLNNAFEVGAQHVTVSAEAMAATEQDIGGVRVTVCDDGPGMSAEVRERAFEPFFTTRGRGRGTGLGLAIVRAVVEAHAGRIELNTQAGGGCRFVMELPTAPGRAPPHETWGSA